MNYYKISLSQDYNYLINHIVVTTLVEKRENNKGDFSLKTYQLSQREMVIITDKEIKEKIYEKIYKTHALRWKVTKEERAFSDKKIGDTVVLEGVLSWAFTPWGSNKPISPLDYRSKKVIHEDKLVNFLSKNTGLKNITYSVTPLKKQELPDNKVIIYNRFKIKIEGIIENHSIFENLKYNNIGKMKTYGHGALIIIENSL